MFTFGYFYKEAKLLIINITKSSKNLNKKKENRLAVDPLHFSSDFTRTDIKKRCLVRTCLFSRTIKSHCLFAQS